VVLLLPAHRSYLVHLLLSILFLVLLAYELFCHAKINSQQLGSCWSLWLHLLQPLVTVHPPC
jgi:hypothetical protein